MRRLALELDLDSGTYTAKMRQASRETEIFHRKIDTTHDSLKRIDKGVNGVTAKLRDFTLIMGNLRSSVENAQFFFTGLISAAVSATSEIERVTFLLRGLSKASTEFGRNREAQQNLEGLIETAKQAPFSLKALSDTFVKFKAGGLDPTNGSMHALLDAVAAFGGSDDLLHRASVAIQQMGGKGVVSMEELRQQLGEAVPTAISLMAKGLGKSYADLVKEISEGKVRAEPALAAMFEQFEIAFGGSAQRMMETFRGRVSQLKTSLTELAMAFTGMDTAGNVTEGSFYDYLKQSVQGLTQLVSSDEFRGSIADIGSLIGETSSAVGMFLEAAGQIRSAIPDIMSLKEAILVLGAAIMGTLARNAAMAMAKFAGSVVTGSQLMVTGLRVEQQARRDANRSALLSAEIRTLEAKEAVAASQAKIAALNGEAAALRALQIEDRRRLMAATNALNTGRNADGSFANRNNSAIAKLAAQESLAATGTRLAAVNTQLTATENALTAAQQRQTAATAAETAALAGSTAAGRAKIAVNAALTGALARMNALLLAASTGVRALGAGLVALTTAQGRANAAIGAGNVLLATMRGAMVAGTVAARGLMVALSFFGGPLGAAILLVAGAIMGVASATKEAQERSEKAKTAFDDTANMLHRMAEEGIIARSATSDLGAAADSTADRIAQVSVDAMAAAKSLDEYAEAARNAAIQEIQAKLALARAGLAETQASSQQGRADRVGRAWDTGTGADGQKTLRDFGNVIGSLWSLGMERGANFVDGGRTAQLNAETAQLQNRTIGNLLSALGDAQDSPVSVYERAYRARPTADSSSPSGAAGGGQRGQSAGEKGMASAVDMIARVRGIEAEIAGAGKEAEKLKFLLDQDPEMRGISQEIKDNMIAAATALDIANERLEGSRALEGLRNEAEQQEETVRRLNEEIALIAVNSGDAVLQNAAYTAGLAEATDKASKYNADEATAARNRAANSQREAQQLVKQRDAMVDLQEAVTSSGLAAESAWEDFASGAVESDRELNRYRRSLAQMLSLIPEGSEKWVAMKANMDRALDNFRIERATEALIEMRNATAEIGRSFLTTGQRAEAEYQAESERYRNLINAYGEGTAKRRQAEEQYYAWKAAKEQELRARNPIVAMALEWQDSMGALTQATSGWIDTLVNGLAEGEMSWKDFTKSMLAEIAKIIIRAIIAQAILSAIGMIAPNASVGLPGGGTATAGQNGWMGGVDSSWGGAVNQYGFRTPTSRVPGLHSGGIAGGTPTFRRRVDPSMFNAAPKFHGGGIAGLKRNEVPAILQRKEGVFTQEQMKALAPVGSSQAVAPNVQVNVINESGQEMTAQQDGGMKFDGRAYILDVVIDAASKPGKMRSALQGVQRG